MGLPTREVNCEYVGAALTGRSQVSPNDRDVARVQCGRPGNRVPCADPQQSPCRLRVRTRRAPGSPGHGARCSRARADKSSSGRPARPGHMRCRPRPRRRSRDASRSAPAIPPSPSCRQGLRLASRAPRFPHRSVSPCPDLSDCECRRTLSVSGFAPGRLFFASAMPSVPDLRELPTRRVHRSAGCRVAACPRRGGRIAGRVLSCA